eukprot:GHVT01048027.1.p1 GENE.GHVT01048027.1~~GHVT01048027.1.p1  ORF type:complete len:349 (+),score=54.63 GHVT01048027.1:843-1889(+)
MRRPSRRDSDDPSGNWDPADPDGTSDGRRPAGSGADGHGDVRVDQESFVGSPPKRWDSLFSSSYGQGILSPGSKRAAPSSHGEAHERDGSAKGRRGVNGALPQSERERSPTAQNFDDISFQGDADGREADGYSEGGTGVQETNDMGSDYSDGIGEMPPPLDPNECGGDGEGAVKRVRRPNRNALTVDSFTKHINPVDGTSEDKDELFNLYCLLNRTRDEDTAAALPREGDPDAAAAGQPGSAAKSSRTGDAALSGGGFRYQAWTTKYEGVQQMQKKELENLQRADTGDPVHRQTLASQKRKVLKLEMQQHDAAIHDLGLLLKTIGTGSDYLSTIDNDHYVTQTINSRK